MGETPLELKADIDHTLKHMDAVVAQLGARMRESWSPGAMARRHPLALTTSALAVLVGTALFVRINVWLSRRAQRRRPIQIYLRR